MKATVKELRDDYDWQEVFEYNTPTPTPTLGYNGSLEPFTFDDISTVIAAVDGESDGSSWVGVFKLKDGRFAMIDAGCDYTGWD
mgnify:CR=1 FL=1